MLSARLTLRKLTVADATPTYAAWLNDPEVHRFLEVRHHTHTVESCREFIAAMNSGDAHHLFGIFLTDSGRHIGNIKLGFIDPRNGDGQLSLFLGDKAAWGQGYATEAIRRMTDFGFRELGLARIEAGIYESNLASLRAFLKAGYSVEGFFRRKYVLDGGRVGSFWLALLKDEWRRDHE